MTTDPRRIATLTLGLALLAAPAPPARPSGRWLGQDGADRVGPSSVPGPSDVQDIHLVLDGLPPRAAIASARVTALGGGEWRYKGPHGPWAADVAKAPNSPRAHVYLEPSQAETGRPFRVELQLQPGGMLAIDLPGGKADPDLRMPGAALAARWLPQDGEDRVTTGPAVGPDGLADARIALERLSGGVEIEEVAVDGRDGLRWRTGVNPRGLPSAELVRKPGDPTRADLFLGLGKDPRGQPLALTVLYANGKRDAAKLVAGPGDPRKAAPRGSAPKIRTIPVTARWLGQDRTDKVGPGDVHVVVEGVPAGAIAGAALSDPSRGLWSARPSDKQPFDPGPWAAPMALERLAGPDRLDLHFPPFRDETGGTMTLRLLMEDGRTLVARFPGGPCDPGLRAAFAPADSATDARPGADLNDLASRFGTIRLAPGVHRMARPLVLTKPVNLVGSPGAILEFSQPADAPAWPSAVKFHSGHTRLEGFAVRFASPIRWASGVDGGPAVIGATDNTDPGPGDLKADIVVRDLDLRVPPPSTDWEEAPRLVRLGRSVCGVIAGNTLRGGAIDLEGGPWRVQGNRYLGTPAGTFSFSVISGRNSHDLIVKDNAARPEPGSGKTWRFLVLAGTGADDLIEGNTVEGVGPRDGDAVPNANAPEIVLTESYALHFEGRPSAVGDGGRVLVVPGLQGPPAGTGAAVAILAGPQAGTWRRVAQAMGPTTYLLDDPLPPGDLVVSIASGFVGETFRRNRIDARGGAVATNLVLAGNHFGLKVIDNHLLGGGDTFRIMATATESPVHWGWSHAPLMGAVFEGNVIEDSLKGGTICVEHTPKIKTTKGRVYASAALKGNVYRAAAPRGSARPIALTLGDAGSLDPSELVVTEHGDRGAGGAPALVRVVGARVNGEEVRDRTFRLPDATDPKASAASSRTPAPR